MSHVGYKNESNKWTNKINKTHRHRHQHGGYQREGSGGVVKGNKGSRTVTEDLAWWAHNAIYRSCIMYTWNLYNLNNQSHPPKFNLQTQKNGERYTMQILSSCKVVLSVLTWMYSVRQNALLGVKKDISVIKGLIYQVETKIANFKAPVTYLKYIKHKMIKTI